MTISPATDADLPDACALYNQYAASSAATFDLAPRCLDGFAAGFLAPPNFGHVARDADGQMLGFVSLAPFIHRPAADQSAEIALYLRPDLCGQGIGPQLLRAIHEDARERGLVTIVAVITTENPRSCAFFSRQGYLFGGALRKIASKGGQDLGVSYYQYML
jgi:L-amino acid N-acyltransferase YncA